MKIEYDSSVSLKYNWADTVLTNVKASVPSKGQNLMSKISSSRFEKDLDALLRLDLGLKEEGRVKCLWNWDLSHPRMLNIKRWAALETSRTLLIYSTNDEHFRRPISFVSAHVIKQARSFREPRSMVCIGHFCRQSSPCPTEDVTNMFRSLLHQLYLYVRDVKSPVSECRLSTLDIADLVEHFTLVLKDLPADSTLVCVIDGLDYYQSEGRLVETCKWTKTLTGIVGQTAARFKLLLTLPFLSGGSLKRCGIPKDDIIAFDGGPDDDRHGLGWDFWRENQLKWS